MEPNFVAAGVASAKANWVEDCSGAFGHEREAFTSPVIVSCFGECVLLPGWRRTKPKPKLEKSVCSTISLRWLKRWMHGSDKMAFFRSSQVACASLVQNGATASVSSCLVMMRIM